MTVGESDVEFLGAGNDGLSLAGGDVLGDLTAVGPVVHKQQFNVFLASDQKLSETTGHHVSGLGGLLLTDVRLLAPTTEATSLGVVDTSGVSPRCLDTHKLAKVETRSRA